LVLEIASKLAAHNGGRDRVEQRLALRQRVMIKMAAICSPPVWIKVRDAKWL